MKIFQILINFTHQFFSDYLAVGSDSGRIVILEYLPAKNCFSRIHQETFGKSGCRRIVPGQYLAADPKGRAIMVGKCQTCLFVVWWDQYLDLGDPLLIDCEMLSVPLDIK